MEQSRQSSMPFGSEEIKRIIGSPEAAQLLKLLQMGDQAGLRQAAEAVRNGDYAKAISNLQPMMNSPASAQLLQQIEKKLG